MRTPPILVALTLSIGLIVAVVFSLRPSSHNVCTVESISKSHGVLREQRLLDGKVPAPGSAVNDFVAALFLTEASFVEFDLGKATDVGYIQLSSYAGQLGIWVSDDGRQWRPLALSTTRARDSALGVYVGRERVRYLKLAPEPGVIREAGFELVVLPNAPDRPPLVHATQDPPTHDAAVSRELSRVSHVHLAQIGVALLFAAIFLVVRRRSKITQLWTYSFFFVLSVFSWFMFTNPLRSLHTWEATHYYLGAKYFEELGYTELYNEIARHEVRGGRGQLFLTQEFRDLETYETRQGAHVLTPEFMTLSSFSPDRQEEFARDADRIRRLFHFRHFSKVVQDHGYNATPLFTSVFSRALRHVPPSRVALTGIALLDILFALAGLGVLWWAYGARAACLAALVFGLAEPWSFPWTGGSIGRYLWFFLLCTGLALIKRERRLLGGFALGLSGMLRLFPLVFLSGLCGIALYRWSRREDTGHQIRLLAGISAALIIGLLVPLLMFSANIYEDFFQNTRLHAQNVAFNRIGLDALLDLWNPDRSALYTWLSIAAGATGAFALCRSIVAARLESWHGFVAGGFLLFFLSPLSSYDYVWLACLAPACVSSLFRTLVLLAMAVAFNIFTEYPVGLPPEATASVVAAAAFALVYASYARQLSRAPGSLRTETL